MKRTSLQIRLRACQDRGNLTLSDMARWFGRPIPTVRGWVERGAKPGGGPIDKDHVEQLLGLLETLIRKRKGFPVPRMAPDARVVYLQDIRATLLSHQ